MEDHKVNSRPPSKSENWLCATTYMLEPNSFFSTCKMYFRSDTDVSKSFNHFKILIDVLGLFFVLSNKNPSRTGQGRKQHYWLTSLINPGGSGPQVGPGA